MSSLVHSYASQGATPDTPVASAPAVVGLQEISLPTPVPYTPQTWGWAVLALLFLLLLAWLGWRGWRHYQARAYRRQALRELALIEAALRQPTGQAAALARLPALVKRVALAWAPREQVAGLSDEHWLAWLDKTWRRGRFTQGAGRLLARVAYVQADAATLAAAPELIKRVRGWIGHHHARF